MHQSTFAATAVDPIPNDNKSIPYGLVRTIRHTLEFIGLLRYIRGLKSKGTRLDLIVVALCTFTMHASNSMNACAEWLKDETTRKMIGFSKNDSTDQKTLNRALEILGKNREGIIEHLWKGINERFEIDDYDIRLDGSAVVLYGPKSEYGKIGYGRDKNRGKPQVEFMVAQLASLGIPIYIKPYRGNVSDEGQYADSIPEITGLISGKGIHSMDALKKAVQTDDEETLATVAIVAALQAAMIADNGMASKVNLDRVKGCGSNYITRMELNGSDMDHVKKEAASFEYIGDGIMCYTDVFPTSKTKRRTYLFLSRDKLESIRHQKAGKLEKDLKILKDACKGTLRKSDYVKIRKIPWVNVEVKLFLQEMIVPINGMDKARLVRENMGPKAGFFKLETNMDLTASEALEMYRKRVGIEHLISSLKRITGIKPIRVWNTDSVNGAMILSLLAEAAISMVRYCMKGTKKESVNDIGVTKTWTTKPSTESIVRSLNHLTLTRFRGEKGPYREVFSNWEPISTEIMEIIRLHESPEWGSKKVPIST